MKKISILSIIALSLASSSCLKSYQEQFDKSSAERATEFLDSIQEMLGNSEYGWRMEYFFGNEDGDHGGINITLEFAKPVKNDDGTVTYPDDVIIRSEEDKDLAEKSRYVLRRDSGPVLCFDTFNPIMHKYGTASSEYYEGQGGDYEFFIVSNPAEVKDRIVLKGKRSGKLSYLYPLTESAEEYNKKMYIINNSFYISTFTGFIGDKYVTGEVDVTNHQFTANEMEIFRYEKVKKKDAEGNEIEVEEPVYDIANTVTQPYILTPDGIRFYETLEVFDKKFDDFEFNFDMEKSDTTLVSKANNLSFKAFIPEDWLPYDYYIGNWTLVYNTSKRINVTLVQEEDKRNYRIKGISDQFDLLADYDVKKGRINLLAQACRKPDTNEIIWSDDTERYYIRLCAWQNGGYLTFSTSVGMEAVLKTKTGEDGKIDMEASAAAGVFNWTDNQGSKNVHTDSFLLYLYDTDDAAESVYGGQATGFKFTGGDNTLPLLKTFTKK
jgi:hypothetical protein